MMCRLTLGTACLWSLLAGTAAAATYPPGFTEGPVTNGLTNPTAMAFAPDGRLFVSEQAGHLRVVKDYVLLPTPFVSLTVNFVGEQGLLGVAFDPGFATNHWIYVYYTATTPNIHNRVSRFTANGDVAVGGSEVVLIDLNVEPLTGTTSHNGGALHFGADGKLYVSVGDNAQGNNSQNLGNRLGKILRLNPDGTIPEDNPFYDTATGVNRAIWAMGLRNPYTFSVQPGTGRIFINDVGQNVWEEINDGVAGANYGWVNCEGPNTFNTDVPCDPAFDQPFYTYDRETTAECAIIGGAFYNPASVQYPAAFLNQYFFTDLCGGWIRTIDPATGIVSPFATGIVQPVDMRLSSDGSIHYLARSGSVYRINYSPPGNARPGAAADFDGNGMEDLAVYRRSNGTWRVRNQFTVQWGDAGDVPVPGDYNGDGTTDLAVYRPSTGQWFVRNQFVVQFGDPSDLPVPGDYNGDGTTDLAVYRPSTGQWFVRNQFALTHGSLGDIPVQADYTGDGATDLAVYNPFTGIYLVRNQAPVFYARGNVPVPADYNGDGTVDVAAYERSNGVWYVLNQGTVQFGTPGDIPVPRDFNGDLTVDIAVYRPATGEWLVRNQFTLKFGDTGDVPVPRGPIPARAMGGDYDGDATTDVAVYRPATGHWFVRNQLAVQFGDPGDVPVPADYNGDGAVDVAVFRPSTGAWYVRGQFAVQYGDAGDVPVPRDYNGDGTMDVAVYRPSTAQWFVRNQFFSQFGQPNDIPVPGEYTGDGIVDLAVYRPSTGQWLTSGSPVQFGDPGDVPIPGDYNGDGRMDIAVYRPSTGQWFVRNQFAVQFGDANDMPVPGDYNGDGIFDVAVYRPSTGQWFVRNRFVVQFGDPADVPVVRVGGPQ
jgi:glucose/arabinose dehydrogenase